MDSARTWTGAEATALRKALNLTNEQFAERLGVAPRTVAYWAEKSTTEPRPAMRNALQQLLDAAPARTRARFHELTEPSGPSAGHALCVAIAIVANRGQVLLVRRRESDGGLGWQFPAGIIKPGSQGEDVAVRETLAETGVHCTVTGQLGSRLHPVTGVQCIYYAADYLAGEPENRDTVENAGVTWAPQDELTRFVDEDTIYAPILDYLKENRDAASR